MKALIIKKRWLDLILAGRKSWELRGSRTKNLGRIGLIESGSGKVMGICKLVEVRGPLSVAELKRTSSRHGVPPRDIGARSPYKRTYAWVLESPRRLRRPRAYRHPQGAVIWVNV